MDQCRPRWGGARHDCNLNWIKENYDDVVGESIIIKTEKNTFCDAIASSGNSPDGNEMLSGTREKGK